MILLNDDSLVNIVFLPVCCTFVSYVWCHIALLTPQNEHNGQWGELCTQGGRFEGSNDLHVTSRNRVVSAYGNPLVIFWNYVETSRDKCSKQGRLNVDQTGVKRQKELTALMKMDESPGYGSFLDLVPWVV